MVNKSHSAGYSILAYQTMFLKVHHPVEFLVASINNNNGDIEELQVCYHEANRMGVKIQTPKWPNITGLTTIVDG